MLIKNHELINYLRINRLRSNSTELRSKSKSDNSDHVYRVINSFEVNKFCSARLFAVDVSKLNKLTYKIDKITVMRKMGVAKILMLECDSDHHVFYNVIFRFRPLCLLFPREINSVGKVFSFFSSPDYSNEEIDLPESKQINHDPGAHEVPEQVVVPDHVKSTKSSRVGNEMICHDLLKT